MFKYYKDTLNNTYAYELDGSQDSFILPNLIRITDEEYISIVTPVNEEPQEQEIVVTPWQLRKALNQLGMRDQIEHTISVSNNRDLKDGWEFTTEFKEFDPFVLMIGQALNASQVDIHRIFNLASEL